MSFTLVLVGRPNVGKSTLFNRLAGRQLALVDDTPGVTRDWREAEARFGDLPLRLIDTAGLEDSFDDSMAGRMRRQTESALDHADAVLFLIDGRSGVTPLDEHFARWLRKRKIPVILGVNKCENERATQSAVGEAYALGLGDPLPLSAAHGIGMDQIYDILAPLVERKMQSAPPDTEEDSTYTQDEDAVPPGLDDLEGREDYELEESTDVQDAEKPVKIAIVGRPNAGKSTLLNALVGMERVMTGPEAGTTRDAIAVDWLYNDRRFRLVDTAGLRRKARITGKIEQMSAADSLRAIRLAQIVILVLDADAALEKQDLHIAGHVLDEGRALVIAVNKWDMVEDRKDALEELAWKLEHALSQAKDIPFVTISALKNRNTGRLMDAVLATYDVWNRRVSTGKLNRWLSAMESAHPAPLSQGRPNRLKYIAQIKSRPPTFALWVSRPQDLPDSYRRYIVNGLRESFDLPGIPVRLLVRASKNPYT